MAQTTIKRTEKLDHYWASERHTDKLLDHLSARRDDYYRYLSESGLIARLYQSWTLYYAFFARQWTRGSSAIRVEGEQAEMRRVEINEYRSVLNLLWGYVVQTLPAWDSLAKNGDAKTLEITKLANQALDAYMDNPDVGLEDAIKRTPFIGILMMAGYLWLPYEESYGETVGVDNGTGQPYQQGEFRPRPKTMLDVVYDWDTGSWKERKWVEIRHRVNRWSLIGEYPHKRDEILRASSQERLLKGELGWVENWLQSSLVSDDYVTCRYFYHVPCNEGGPEMDPLTGQPMPPEEGAAETISLAKGRYIVSVGDEALEDTHELPEGVLPVARWVPDDFVLTSFGWTPAVDAQGPQEALNAVASTILTNQNNLGQTKLWVKTGEVINQDDLEPGINLIQTETPPQPINFLSTPPELFKAWEAYTTVIEKMFGVAAVSRGAPPPNVKSGNMAALVDSRTQQSASQMIANWDMFLGEVGTIILRTLKKRGGKRLLQVGGLNRRRQAIEFLTDDLDLVDRVAVVRGNPMMRSFEGRAQIAQLLAQMGVRMTIEEMETVLFTGDLTRLTEINTQNLAAIAAENDSMLQGRVVDTVAAHQNQVLHILKHAAQMERPDIIEDPARFQIFLMHQAKHIEMLKDPFVLWLQQVLGYPAIPAPMAPGMPGMGPQAPQGGAGLPMPPGGLPPGGDPNIGALGEAGGPELPDEAAATMAAA